jgi:hypothetical protein
VSRIKIGGRAAGHKTEQVPAENEASDVEPLTHEEAVQYLRNSNDDEQQD